MANQIHEDILRRYSRGNQMASTIVGLPGAWLLKRPLKKLAAEGEVLDLQGSVLSNANLHEASMPGADLRGADLAGCYLVLADLRGADLRDMNLAGADLRSANLQGVDLTRANLAGADLRGADLRGAKLVEANLAKAKLSISPGVSTGSGYLFGPFSTKVNDADFSGANLAGANLRGTDFTQATLDPQALSGAKTLGARGLSKVSNNSGASIPPQVQEKAREVADMMVLYPDEQANSAGTNPKQEHNSRKAGDLPYR